MHHTTLVVLERRGGGPPVCFADVRRLLADRLPSLAVFRQRLVAVPLGLTPPALVDDPAFDLDAHLHRSRVAPPGGEAQLAAAVVAANAGLLDRRRPLWDLHVLEGLDGGRTAVLLRIHHAVCDGMGAVTVHRLLFGGHPADPRAGARGIGTDGLPTRRAVLRAAAVHQRRTWVGVPDLVTRSRQNRRTAPERPATPPPPAVPMRFNRAVGPTRTWARTTLAVADVHAVRTAVPGTSTNDVVLAVVAGGLRAHLAAGGDLPDRSLVASIPVELARTVGRQQGNDLWFFDTTLATDVAAPVARLRRIHAGTTAGQKQMHRSDPATLRRWLDVIPPPVLEAGRKLAARRQARSPRITTNLTVSSMLGAPTVLAAGDLVVEEVSLSGPVFDGAPVNVSAYRYAGRFTLTVHADAGAVPDAAGLVAAMDRSMTELLAATRSVAAPGTIVQHRPVAPTG